MPTKTVHVKQRSGNQSVNLQIVANSEAGVPLFEPHEKPADRVKPPVGTALVDVCLYVSTPRNE